MPYKNVFFKLETEVQKKKQKFSTTNLTGEIHFEINKHAFSYKQKVIYPLWP